MDLATRKYNFIEHLVNVDENLFVKLEALLATQDSSNNISLKQYNIELTHADFRIENGEFYTGEEVLKIANQW
jgi:hypothetical protein